MKPAIGPIGWMLLGSACTVALLAPGLIAQIVPSGLVEAGKNDAFVSAIAGGLVSGAMTVVAGLFAIRAAQSQIAAQKEQGEAERLRRVCQRLRTMLHVLELFAADLASAAQNHPRFSQDGKVDELPAICSELVSRVSDMNRPVHEGVELSTNVIMGSLVLERTTKDAHHASRRMAEAAAELASMPGMQRTGARGRTKEQEIENHLNKLGGLMIRLSDTTVRVAAAIVGAHDSAFGKLGPLAPVGGPRVAARAEMQKVVDIIDYHHRKVGLR